MVSQRPLRLALILRLALLLTLLGCVDEPTRSFDNPCDPVNGGTCGDAAPDRDVIDAQPEDVPDLGPVECPACNQCLGPVCAWSPPDDAPPEPTLLGPATVVQAEVDTSGALEPGAAWIGNIDGDPQGLVETIVLRGGRVEVFDDSGRLRWRTAPLGARLIRGVADLNQDNRREIIVTGTSATSALALIDARSGDLRWTLAPDPFDEGRPAAGVDTVFVTDLDRDPAGRPELFITEGGCSDASGGRGRFAVYTFADEIGEDGRFVARRRGFGRTPGADCGRDHVIARLSDGPRVIMVGNETINAVEVLSDFDAAPERLACGTHICADDAGQCWAGRATLTVADLDDDGVDEVLAVRRGRLTVFRERPVRPDDVLPECGGRRTDNVLASAWQFAAPDEGRVESTATMAVPLGCPGVPGRQLLTSWSTPAGAQTAWLDATGEPQFTLDGRLLGALDLADDTPRALLIGVGTPTPTGYPQIELWGLDADCQPVGPLWTRADADALRRLPDVRRIARSRRDLDAAERGYPPILMGAAGDARQVALLRTPFPEEADAPLVVEVVGADGAAGPLQPLASVPGAITADCGSTGCAPDAFAQGVALSTATDRPGGRLIRVDARLAPAGEVITVPSRTSTLSVAGAPAHVIAINPFGNLFDLGDVAGPVMFPGAQLGRSTAVRWSQPMRRGADETPTVLVRDFNDPDEIAWALVALDGGDPQPIWRHAAARDDFFFPHSSRIVAADVNGDGIDDVVRFERLRHGDAPVECDGRPPRIVADTDPDCPALEPPHQPAQYDWRLMAVDGRDPDTCLWSTVLKPYCSTAIRGFENLSVVGDPPALVVTQNETIRRLTLDGAHLSSARLPPWQTPAGEVIDRTAARGGRVIATGAAAIPYVLIGGNGPPIGLDADLRPVWRAPMPCLGADVPTAPGDGCGSSAWVGVEAAAVDGAYLWTTMGRGLPLARISLQPVPETAWFGVRDGEMIPARHPLDPACAAAGGDPGCGPFARVTAVVEGPGLLGAQGALLVGADDGFLYALAADGTQAWSRALRAEVGAPLVLDLDDDGRQEMVVPLGDGRVLHLDDRGVAPPTQAWDFVPPDADPCLGEDVDVTTCRDVLCAAWMPIEGQPQHDIRILGPNDAPQTPWRQTDAEHVDACVRQLKLEPNTLYRVEIRARRPRPDGPTDYSASIFTDGVRISSDARPTVAVAAPPCLAQNQGNVEITVTATDDERLEHWSLRILDASGQTVRAHLPEAILGVADLQTAWFWDQRDGQGERVAPGRYMVRATINDSSDQSATADTPVQIVADAAECPPQ